MPLPPAFPSQLPAAARPDAAFTRRSPRLSSEARGMGFSRPASAARGSAVPCRPAGRAPRGAVRGRAARGGSAVSLKGAEGRGHRGRGRGYAKGGGAASGRSGRRCSQARGAPRCPFKSPAATTVRAKAGGERVRGDSGVGRGGKGRSPRPLAGEGRAGRPGETTARNGE